MFDDHECFSIVFISLSRHVCGTRYHTVFQPTVQCNSFILCLAPNNPFILAYRRVTVTVFFHTPMFLWQFWLAALEFPILQSFSVLILCPAVLDWLHNFHCISFTYNWIVIDTDPTWKDHKSRRKVCHTKSNVVWRKKMKWYYYIFNKYIFFMTYI